MLTVQLVWERFERLTTARLAFKDRPCVYVQADPSGKAVRVGMASKGLEARYRGGTGYALDAAMHGSGNFVFVAAVDAGLCAAVEATLIFEGCGDENDDALPHNNQGKLNDPRSGLTIVHGGDPPRFSRRARSGRSAQ